MCNLCDEGTWVQSAERKRLKYLNEKLGVVSAGLRGLASGSLPPHSDAAAILGHRAIAVAHALIKEFA